jgi:hypothetical protein
MAAAVFYKRWPCRVCAWVAQLVEQGTENPRVGGSIPSPGTTFSEAVHKTPYPHFLIPAYTEMRILLRFVISILS